MNVFTRLAYAMGLSVLLAAGAAATPVEQYTQYLPAGTNLAMIAQRVGDSQPIVEYQGQQMALPASTQKVVTALAALLQLGPDFRFTTSLETKGHVEGTTLKGDLITRFTGDPTLTRQQIRNMVNELRKAGVQAIDGDLVIDISAFASHDKAPGWVWNDLTQCFSAPPGAAIIDRNCF
ncbi:D-alanyl-D-alanine carboxypeptidase, partial [Morganella morganii]